MAYVVRAIMLPHRFWYRWSVVRVSERLNIAPPIFRPRMPAWDTWLWEHHRSRELAGRIMLLHRGFRLRHCFRFWHFFTMRNKWVGLGEVGEGWVSQWLHGTVVGVFWRAS